MFTIERETNSKGIKVRFINLFTKLGLTFWPKKSEFSVLRIFWIFEKFVRNVVSAFKLSIARACTRSFKWAFTFNEIFEADETSKSFFFFKGNRLFKIGSLLLRKFDFSRFLPANDPDVL